jgi:tight adherence protein C
VTGPLLPGLLASASAAAFLGGLFVWSRPVHVPAAAPVSVSVSTLPAPTERTEPHSGRRATRRRRAALDRQVPQLLDLLAAGSSAGLSAELALRRAAEALPGELGEELREVFGDADLGGRWRANLAALAASSGSSDLRRTVAVLERTEILGSSLVEATRDLASAVRQSRRSATLERARTAPVKMLFPLVFMILPAFLLLTVVPVLLTTVRSIR